MFLGSILIQHLWIPFAHLLIFYLFYCLVLFLLLFPFSIGSNYRVCLLFFPWQSEPLIVSSRFTKSRESFKVPRFTASMWERKEKKKRRELLGLNRPHTRAADLLRKVQISLHKSRCSYVYCVFYILLSGFVCFKRMKCISHMNLNNIL